LLLRLGICRLLLQISPPPPLFARQVLLIGQDCALLVLLAGRKLGAHCRTEFLGNVVVQMHGGIGGVLTRVQAAA
jgi:hypothetical protein